MTEFYMYLQETGGSDFTTLLGAGRGREGKRWFVTGRRTEAQLDGKNMGVMEKSLVKASHEMYKKNTGSESKHLKIKMKKET